MEINADFSKRVAVHAARLPWIPSRPSKASTGGCWIASATRGGARYLDRPVRAA